MKKKELQQYFRKTLLAWHADNARDLPWKKTRDPYLIWLSEIILQQTRVEQGLPYFEKFSQAYPKLELLAAASEDEVLKNWEGLGYYSRARNMHSTAKQLVREHKSRFPDNYPDLLKLKGVGAYTAAAIASFAFGQAHAVVDGNVYRVLARYFNIDTPTNETSGKKQFAQLAQELLDKTQPGKYNQAIMDFGATLCTPAKPACKHCPFHQKCQAFLSGQILNRPVKVKAKDKKTRHFQFLIIRYEDQVLLEKRKHKDIWRGLFQFPLIETNTSNPEELLQSAIRKMGFPLDILRQSPPFKQTLSHQYIHAQFWELSCTFRPNTKESDFILVSMESLPKFAFPKIIDWFLKDKSLYLELL